MDPITFEKFSFQIKQLIQTESTEPHPTAMQSSDHSIQRNLIELTETNNLGVQTEQQQGNIPTTPALNPIDVFFILLKYKDAEITKLKKELENSNYKYAKEKTYNKISPGYKYFVERALSGTIDTNQYHIMKLDINKLIELINQLADNGRAEPIIMYTREKNTDVKGWYPLQLKIINDEKSAAQTINLIYKGFLTEYKREKINQWFNAVLDAQNIETRIRNLRELVLAVLG